MSAIRPVADRGISLVGALVGRHSDSSSSKVRLRRRVTGDCFVLSSVVREWVVSVELEQSSAAPASLSLSPLENCRASTSILYVLPSYKEPTVDALASRTDEGRG